MRNIGQQGAIEAIEVMSDNERKSDNNGRDEESGVARSVKCCDARWKKIAWGIFVAFLLLLGIVLLATSLKKLNSTEYGVQYNVHSKQLDDAARTGGLHAGPPGYEFIKFPSTFVTVDLPSDICVSRNGLRVQFDVVRSSSTIVSWFFSHLFARPFNTKCPNRGWSTPLCAFETLNDGAG